MHQLPFQRRNLKSHSSDSSGQLGPISRSGFSILEALIAVAIGGIAVAGMVAMMEQINGSTSEQKFVYEGNNLNEDI